MMILSIQVPVIIFEALQTLGDGDFRAVTEIVAGGGDVEPVRRTHFTDDEAGEARFVWIPGDAMQRFHAEGGQQGESARNRSFDKWSPGGSEELVDQFPRFHWFALGDEIRMSGDGRSRMQSLSGEEMGVDGIVNIKRVNSFLAPANAPEFSRPRAFNKSGDDVMVARPPNQVRTQRDGGQLRVVGPKN